jgi:molybdopterin/thiamine biosynthesis adenylyltransferase
MSAELAGQLASHLDRADGQEDLAFLVWHPSVGATRTTAIIHEVVWPGAGDRIIHGNASFTSAYFLRAAGRAAELGAGLALIHSHPRGRGWQQLSDDDRDAEAAHAARAVAITGLPLVGLTRGTLGGSYSARFWRRRGPRDYRPMWCENVRIVGTRLQVSWNDELRPRPRLRANLTRTVSAWGPETQATLARLRVGVVGVGSVGAIVAEALARMGIERIVLLDFDSVEQVNLDRLLHAAARDAALCQSKVEVLSRSLRRSATAERSQVITCDRSVVEPEGFGTALDCDVLFSCVDRPWPRAALNLIAYAHLIPVVDGGIRVHARRERMIGAEWRAHMAAPGRACLECLGQYDPALVQAERSGLLDDPTYIAGLSSDHPLRRNENVFTFSLATAAAEVLELLRAVVAPGGVADVGALTFHFTTGSTDRKMTGCADECPYTTELLAMGDNTGINVTGRHLFAENARSHRAEHRKDWRIRFRCLIRDLLWKLR